MKYVCINCGRNYDNEKILMCVDCYNKTYEDYKKPYFDRIKEIQKNRPYPIKMRLAITFLIITIIAIVSMITLLISKGFDISFTIILLICLYLGKYFIDQVIMAKKVKMILSEFKEKYNDDLTIRRCNSDEIIVKKS